MKVSIIIPVYNEEAVIENCLNSLSKQTLKSEIIVVDDGSIDSTSSLVTGHWSLVTYLKQNHFGPGAARNLGASKASGDILVFVDADMEFAPDFIEKLIIPIAKGVIGTYSKEEYLLNKDKPLARCWNLNFGRSIEKMDPRGYAHKATGIYKIGKNILEKIEGTKVEESKNRVFRAILKEKFLSVGGFDTKVGYTDDWSLSLKLNDFPAVAPGAIYYHRSPDKLPEIWKQARWYGKNEFLTKNIIRKLYNLFRYFPIFGLFKGIWGIWKYKEWQFLLFKIVFDTAVFVSVLRSFINESKNR